MKRLRENVAIWIAWHLPREVVRWAMVRTFSHASGGQWGNEHPEGLRYSDVAKRWDIAHNA